MTSARLKSLGLIDGIVTEPLGGAHRDVGTTAQSLKAALVKQLDEICALNNADRSERRYQRLRAYGASKAA